MSYIASLLPRPSNHDTKEHDKIEADSISSQGYELVAGASSAPPYGERSEWRPTKPEDFDDGGAYPEVHVAQFPLGMGQAVGAKKKSNQIDLKYDSEGNVRYDLISRRGYGNEVNVQSSYKDLVPLRHQANSGDLSLERPTEEDVKKTTEKTKSALDLLLSGKLEKSRPNAVTKKKAGPTYVRYTPASQMGQGQQQQRIIRVQEHQKDPLQISAFKETSVPDRPASPPVPVLHAPVKKTSKEERAQWHVPPAVSNWKNPKGFAVDLDKRVAADGRHSTDNSINDKKAALAEALFKAEKDGRQEIRDRAIMQEKAAAKEQAEREEQLAKLARQARQQRSGPPPDQQKDRMVTSQERSRIRSSSRDGNTHSRREKSMWRDSSEDRAHEYSDYSDEETAASLKRAEERRERQRQREKELRMSRMGSERRAKELARDEDRDISEKVALGLAKSTKLSGDALFDARLFNYGSAPKYNEDQVYDKSMFATREAINSIYKTRGGAALQSSADDEEHRIASENRFEALGKASKGFKGADKVAPTEGPVEFEKSTELVVEVDDDNDPYQVNEMIDKVRYGLNEGPSRKRQRRDD